jgi:hypothetical protein
MPALLIELMVDEIRSGPPINIDGSPYQMLNDPSRSNTTTS